MTDRTARLSRRTVLGAAAAGTVVTGLGASGSARSAAATAEPDRRRLRPVSMAMHIHGPFSEGIARTSGSPRTTTGARCTSTARASRRAS